MRKVKLWKLLTCICIGRSWSFQDLWITRNYVNKKLKVVLRKKILFFEKNMKIIRWPYKVPLKSLTGHTSLWLTDSPYHDQREQGKTSLWQFMVLSMISISGQPGRWLLSKFDKRKINQVFSKLSDRPQIIYMPQTTLHSCRSAKWKLFRLILSHPRRLFKKITS